MEVSMAETKSDLTPNPNYHLHHVFAHLPDRFNAVAWSPDGKSLASGSDERDHSRVRVHTRCMRKSDGAWEGRAVWPANKGTERRTYYDIDLSR
jgi:WD40 repeat protein